MPQLDVSSTADALILFVDIVDSSKYSAILGYEEYARRILEFQKLFERLGQQYFPQTQNRSEEFTSVKARGDEGLVFYITLSGTKADLVFSALELVFELKGRLHLAGDSSKTRDMPKQMDLGAGIHFGPVACITAIESGRSIIDRVEGFSINYAKRVESCSRIGKYSRVFLSKEAARLLEGEPIVLSKLVAPMEGIEEHAEVYEVLSGFFRNVPIETNSQEDEKLIDEVCELADYPDKIDEPWLKSFVVSVLDSLLRNTPDPGLKNIYRDRQLKLAWHSAIEDDPILLYIRALDYQERREYTQQLRYLKEIVEKYLEFIHAKKKMVEACWMISQSDAERAEKVYAIDVAKEFLEKFPDYLSNEEKRKFEELVKGR